MPAVPAVIYGGAQFTGPAADGTSGQVLRRSATALTLEFGTVTAGIDGTTGGTDNAVLRADGTGGSTAQAGTIAILTDAGSFTTTAGNSQYTSASGDVQIGEGNYFQPSQLRVYLQAAIQWIQFAGYGLLLHCVDSTRMAVHDPSHNNLDFECRDLVATRTVRHAAFTVATLPTAGTAGRAAYASNGRKNGEGAGAGTGVLVFDDGVAWRAVDTGATVAA